MEERPHNKHPTQQGKPNRQLRRPLGFKCQQLQRALQPPPRPLSCRPSSGNTNQEKCLGFKSLDCPFSLRLQKTSTNPQNFYLICLIQSFSRPTRPDGAAATAQQVFSGHCLAPSSPQPALSSLSSLWLGQSLAGQHHRDGMAMVLCGCWGGAGEPAEEEGSSSEKEMKAEMMAEMAKIPSPFLSRSKLLMGRERTNLQSRRKGHCGILLLRHKRGSRQGSSEM